VLRKFARRFCLGGIQPNFFSRLSKIPSNPKGILTFSNVSRNVSISLGLLGILRGCRRPKATPQEYIDAKWMRNGCEMGAEWMRNGCEMDAKWIRNGCETDAKRMRNECETDAKWMRNGCELDAKRMRNGCEMDAGWMRNGCEMDAKWIGNGCEMDAKWIRGLKELSKIPSNPNEILTFPEMLVFP